MAETVPFLRTSRADVLVPPFSGRADVVAALRAVVAAKQAAEPAGITIAVRPYLSLTFSAAAAELQLPFPDFSLPSGGGAGGEDRG